MIRHVESLGGEVPGDLKVIVDGMAKLQNGTQVTTANQDTTEADKNKGDTDSKQTPSDDQSDKKKHRKKQQDQ